MTTARTSPRGGGGGRRRGDDSCSGWLLVSIVIGVGGQEYPVVTAAHGRGGGALPGSQHTVLSIMQLRDEESKVAKRPLRAMAMYLRECGIS